MNDINKWFADNGDNTHRLNYNLNTNSIVFDVGGYNGNWAESIYNRYGCNIHIFEPVTEFYNKIIDKFENISKIHTHKFGLSNITTTLSIGKNNDSSSIFIDSSDSEVISIQNINEFIDNTKIPKIDLIKINIEGCEYDLLDALLKENFINNIDNLQIQFHRIGENYEYRRQKIVNFLKNTHHITYEYPFIWENWKRNE